MVNISLKKQKGKKKDWKHSNQVFLERKIKEVNIFLRFCFTVSSYTYSIIEKTNNK